MDVKKKKSLFLLLTAVIAMLHVALVVGYGMQKEGFHEDEYYTYWSGTNETPTISQNYVWYRGHDLMSKFFVGEGQGFSFAKVVQNQAWDVHPPLYYVSLHIFMSLFPGRFYKWFGILLNLLYSLITYGGIVLFCYRMDHSDNRYMLSLLSGLSYVVAPSSVSNCMLARMYTMSGMWTVIYANIFLLLLQNYQSGWRKFLKIVAAGAITCYLSFLTHYFTLLVPFALTVFYCGYVLYKRKGIVKMAVYGCCMLAAIAMAVLTFPASYGHIFRGYRGTGAMNSFKSGGILGMMTYFLPILNRYVFAGWMWGIMILTGICLVVGMILLIGRCRKRQNPATKFYPLAASVCSCIFGIWFLCRTALALGSDSARYFYPVIAFLLPLIVYSIGKTACCLPLLKRNGSYRCGLAVVLAILVILPSFAGYAQGNVLFLYADEKEKISFSREYREYPAVVIYNGEAPYREWYAADQLWVFENIFYADYEHMLEDFEEERLFTAEKTVVFLDSHYTSADVLNVLLENNSGLNKYTLVRQDQFFNVYLLE